MRTSQAGSDRGTSPSRRTDAGAGAIPPCPGQPNYGRSVSRPSGAASTRWPRRPWVAITGKYDEAEPPYCRALAVFERVYGSMHYEVAVTLNNLAALLQAKGDVVKAEPLYRRALALKEKLLGPDHPDRAMTLNNLAVPCKARGKHAEAATLYRRSLAVFERALGKRHPKTVACRANYARLCGRG